MSISSGETRESLSTQVAEEIRVILTRRRMSGRQLAQRLNVSPSWVSYRLSGSQPIDLNDLQRIADVLGVSVGELLPPGALQRRPQPLPGTQTTQPSVAQTGRRRGRTKRSHRSATRRHPVPVRPAGNRPAGQIPPVATTPMTRRPALIRQTSDR